VNPSAHPEAGSAAADAASPTSTDRRRFLRNAGVVGVGVAGATWAAPSMLTLERAFAAGSCCAQNTLNLLAAPFGNGVDLTVGSYTALGTTMTFSRTRQATITNTTCTPTDWTTAVVTNCQQGNDSAGQIPITSRGTDGTTANSVTITFSTAVRNLSFVITDIDASNLSTVEYQEQEVISWTQGTGTSVPVYTPGTGLSFVSANTYKATSNTVNATQTDTFCNLGVAFGCGGTVKSVTVTSQNLNTTGGSSNTQGRYVGIAQIKFCI
jgi:hypothetical protein